MFSDIMSVVRSNQNAVMFRFGTVYTIFDLKQQDYPYTGTGDECRSAWNAHYKNSRQFVTPNGVNHRYMG